MDLLYKSLYLMFYLLISHNKKNVKIHGTPLLRINITRQPMVLQTKIVQFIEAKMLLNNPVCRNMVLVMGKASISLLKIGTECPYLGSDQQGDMLAQCIPSLWWEFRLCSHHLVKDKYEPSPLQSCKVAQNGIVSISWCQKTISCPQASRAPTEAAIESISLAYL